MNYKVSSRYTIPSGATNRRTIWNKVIPSGIPTDYIAAWLLNGDATDETGNYDGIATDVTWTNETLGPNSQVGSFNGSSSKISYGSLGLDNTGSFTFNFWFTSDNPSLDQRCTYSDDADDILIIPKIKNNHIGIYAHDGSNNEAEGTTTLSSGTWYMGTWEFNAGGTSYVYLNGGGTAEASINTGNFEDLTTQFGRYIGSGRNGNLNFWDGKIGLFRVYPRALTAAERTALYNEV